VKGFNSGHAISNCEKFKHIPERDDLKQK